MRRTGARRVCWPAARCAGLVAIQTLFAAAGYAGNSTTAGVAAATVSSCQQITVWAPFSGDDNADGTVKVEYNTSNSWPGSLACAAAAGPSPRTCLATGLTASTLYYIRVTYSDPDGVTGTAVQVLPGSYTTPACSGNGAAPMVMFLSPATDATVGGVENVKVQVYDPDGVAANHVVWGLDGASPSSPTVVNANYACNIGNQSGCAVYEFSLDTTTLANGPHAVTVQATDSAPVPSVAVASLSFIAHNAGVQPAGGGTLLRRTLGSELCLDCHNLASHTSQATSFAYGSWAEDCLTCHTPHLTNNIYLIRPQILTPASGREAVDFRNTSGKADYSFATVTTPGNGVCEVCHTKTKNPDGSPRYRNTGESDGGKHYSSSCINCHLHSKGFAAGESEGGATCSGCHADIWNGMTGGVAKTSRHTLGNALGVNDAFTDSGVTWGNPLSSNGASARSCLNMCHEDHPHTLTSPAVTTHENNAYLDATSQASRAAASRTSGDKDKTDFEGAQTNGGMCLSCHRNPVDAAHPPVDKTAYTAAAHNYTSFGSYGAWTYVLHDSSVFSRNCTKCHADRGDGRPGDSSYPFGAVHFSDFPMLLAGSKNPAGAPATFVCYNCHGNGTTGQNLSGKNIATQMAKVSAHPSNADAVHNTVTESNQAAFGNTLGVSGRHASCLDCHATHQAKAGTHSTPGNLAGPPLEGAWGAALSSNPAFWAAPAAANFTKRTIVAGTDLEATLCFKCHSAYYGTLPTAPSGGFTETDTAREFNPNNTNSGSNYGSYHPVLASAGSNLGATSNILSPWTRTSTMTCSDCHESDNTADPNGPHGSTAGFILKGPNTKWDGTVGGTTSGMPAGTFCANCHSATFANSRFPRHTLAQHTTSPPSGGPIKCFNCHSAIPHGTARPGLLVCPSNSSSINGVLATDAAPYLQLPSGNQGLRINSYPTSNTATWGQSNCGCGNDGWGH